MGSVEEESTSAQPQLEQAVTLLDVVLERVAKGSKVQISWPAMLACACLHTMQWRRSASILIIAVLHFICRMLSLQELSY